MTCSFVEKSVHVRTHSLEGIWLSRHRLSSRRSQRTTFWSALTTRTPRFSFKHQQSWSSRKGKPKMGVFSGVPAAGEKSCSFIREFSPAVLAGEDGRPETAHLNSVATSADGVRLPLLGTIRKGQMVPRFSPPQSRITARSCRRRAAACRRPQRRHRQRHAS